MSFVWERICLRRLLNGIWDCCVRGMFSCGNYICDHNDRGTRASQERRKVFCSHSFLHGRVCLVLDIIFVHYAHGIRGRHGVAGAKSD